MSEHLKLQPEQCMFKEELVFVVLGREKIIKFRRKRRSISEMYGKIEYCVVVIGYRNIDDVSEQDAIDDDYRESYQSDCY